MHVKPGLCPVVVLPEVPDQGEVDEDEHRCNRRTDRRGQFEEEAYGESDEDDDDVQDYRQFPEPPFEDLLIGVLHRSYLCVLIEVVFMRPWGRIRCTRYQGMRFREFPDLSWRFPRARRMKSDKVPFNSLVVLFLLSAVRSPR